MYFTDTIMEFFMCSEWGMFSYIVRIITADEKGEVGIVKVGGWLDNIFNQIFPSWIVLILFHKKYKHFKLSSNI